MRLGSIKRGSRCPLSIRQPPIVEDTHPNTTHKLRVLLGIATSETTTSKWGYFCFATIASGKPKADPCFDYASSSVALQQTSLRHLLPYSTTSHEIYSRNISWRSSIAWPDRPFSAKTINLHPGDARERNIQPFGKVGKGQHFNPVTHRC